MQDPRSRSARPIGTIALAAMAMLLGACAFSPARAAPGPAATPVARPGDRLDYDDARHLLNRTGFGATESEVRHFVGKTRADAARELLDNARTTAVTTPPAWTSDTGSLRYPRRPDATEEERKIFQREQIREGLELRGWWVGEMLATPSPLTERMTLFWHNHFVSGQQKVKLARLMYGQNVTLRANALGNFGDLLHAIARDPAMVVYLDSAQNRKGTPNENFAREVMELFTLGEGQYQEQDIKEAARAFTGWSLDRDSGEFMFRRGIHDYGVKTVFGKSGHFDGDDVLDVLLAQPATAAFITRKLWREFISPDPDPAEVDRIARRFRDSHYDIKVAVYGLITSDAFYARDNRAALIKSPVDLVVGTLKQFGLHPADAMPFAVAAAGMGQNLFSPPNVKGWPGQDTWINTSTLLARKQFLQRLFRADDVTTPSATASASATSAAMPALMPDATMAAADDAMVAAVPRQALLPQGAQDPDKARQVRFQRAMERGVSNVPFDSAEWLAGLHAPADSQWRNDAAEKLLLATAPQAAPDATSEPLALIRGLVLDAAYQLK